MTRKALDAYMQLEMKDRDKVTKYPKYRLKSLREICITTKKPTKEKNSKYGQYVERDHLVKLKHIIGRGKCKK